MAFIRLNAVLEVPAIHASAANELLLMVLEKHFTVAATEITHFDSLKDAMKDHEDEQMSRLHRRKGDGR